MEIRSDIDSLRKLEKSRCGSVQLDGLVSIRDMIEVTTSDIRSFRLALTELELFKYRYPDDFERKKEAMVYRILKREKILMRLFKTRHQKY